MEHFSKFNPNDFKFQIPQNHKRSKGIPYCDTIFTADTETTSLYKMPDGSIQIFDKSKPSTYYNDCVKIGVCYIWMMSVDGCVYYGRYLDEFAEFIKTVSKELKGCRMVIYVHNLSFDYQFFRNCIYFDDVFAREKRKPMRAISSSLNVEFRDSYVLSNSSLDGLGKNYNLKVRKLVGYLDYNKLRIPSTDLTADELAYCEHDCLVLHEYVQYKLNQYKTMKKIPMTQTGEVRLELKQKIIENGRNPIYAVKDWKKKVAKLTPDYDTYMMLVDAYAGGYTHANALRANILQTNVTSWDFTSSYPYVILAFRYPITTFTDCEKNLDNINTDRYAYLMKIKMYDVDCMYTNTFISYSKCKEVHGFILDNGRVMHADSLTITITEQDWLTIQQMYSYTKIEVLELKRAVKGWLPKPLTALVADLYIKKGELKHVKGMEDKYRILKAMLNSIYGCTVTKYITDEVMYLDGIIENGETTSQWLEYILSDEDVMKRLCDFRTKDELLLPYQWGVWVSAYARRNIMRAIIANDMQVCYSDTDSIKVLGDVKDYVEVYNNECYTLIEDFGKRNNIDASKLHPIGEFDFDGHYDEFKTLGAKKYCVRYHRAKRYRVLQKGFVKSKIRFKKSHFINYDEYGLHITISGVNKKKGYKALHNDINNFKDGLVFDYNNSGRMISSYNDKQPEIKVTDFQSHTDTIHQRYGINLMPTTYIMGITDDYDDITTNAHEFGTHGSMILVSRG